MADQRGSLNANWRGGRSIASNGYVLIRVGTGHHLADVRGYAYEHRVVAENSLGRRLVDEAQAIGESLDAIRSRFGLETPPADPIAAIRARHDAVEQRREWTSTVVTSDGERAHLDRGELLDIVCKVIGGER